MKIGKIPADTLEKIILNPINNNKIKRDDIIIRPKTGEDCSAAFLGDELIVISTDPITGAKKDSGYIAVHINCNDIASSGAEPVGIMLTLLLPPESDESTINEIMQGAYEAAKELNIEIMGGHTEVTQAVNTPVISGTVIGKTRNKKFISSGGAEVGQDVIMTKWAGLEGTVIIAKDYEEKLKGKIDDLIIDNAIKMKGFLSVLKESKIAFEFGATAMHDVTEGGILGAVWEVADCSKKGIIIYEDKISVKKETLEICNIAKINPYCLISSGCLIITIFDGINLVNELKKNGIEAEIIGKITQKDKIVIRKGEKQILNSPDVDELYKVRL